MISKRSAAFLNRTKDKEYFISYSNFHFFCSLEEGRGEPNIDDSESAVMLQKADEVEHLKRRQDSVRNIQKALEETMGIFTRISSVVQMHDVMIERIDKNVEDSVHNVQKGKKNLLKYYKNMTSSRRWIISVFFFLVFFMAIYIILIM